MRPGGRKKLHEMQLQSAEEGKIKESNNADLRVFCNTSARLLFKREGKGSVRYQSSFSSLRTLSRERPWATLNEPRVGSMSVAPCDFSRFDSRFAILFLSRTLFSVVTCNIISYERMRKIIDSDLSS